LAIVDGDWIFSSPILSYPSLRVTDAYPPNSRSAPTLRTVLEHADTSVTEHAHTSGCKGHVSPLLLAYPSASSSPAAAGFLGKGSDGAGGIDLLRRESDPFPRNEQPEFPDLSLESCGSGDTSGGSNLSPLLSGSKAHVSPLLLAAAKHSLLADSVQVASLPLVSAPFAHERCAAMLSGAATLSTLSTNRTAANTPLSTNLESRPSRPTLSANLSARARPAATSSLVSLLLYSRYRS